MTHLRGTVVGTLLVSPLTFALLGFQLSSLFFSFLLGFLLCCLYKHSQH